MRVLLVEDDPMIGEAMQKGLKQAGFAVDWMQDGVRAEALLAEKVHHVIVLDLGLPGRGGLELLKNLRAAENQVPVIVVTARDGVDDRVGGLNLGADDYMVKPFDLDELIARVRALLRRHAGSGNPIMVCGDLTLDPMRKAVSYKGDAVDLSGKELAILEALMRRPGAVLSRKALEEAIYGSGDEIGSNAVEVHLHHLRKKLGADLIRNIRGVGYWVAE